MNERINKPKAFLGLQHVLTMYVDAILEDDYPQSLNALSEKEFTKFLGDTFEHSPWIAEKSAANRPFSPIINLHRCMVDIVSNSSKEEKLMLIRKHPNFGDKVEMSDDSNKEQRVAD